MADLTSTARIKRALGIPSSVTRHDEYISELADAVDHEVLGYTGQASLTRTTRTDKLDIQLSGTSEVMLPAFPIHAVSEVVSAGTTLTTGDYYFEPNTGAVRLIASGATFEQGKQTVEVSYTCGFADGSNQLKTLAMAATIIACARFNQTRHQGMFSEGMAGYRYMLDTKTGVPPQAVTILSQFVRVVAFGSTQ